jgi:hypothetical protein
MRGRPGIVVLGVATCSLALLVAGSACRHDDGTAPSPKPPTGPSAGATQAGATTVAPTTSNSAD